MKDIHTIFFKKSGQTQKYKQRQGSHIIFKKNGMYNTFETLKSKLKGIYRNVVNGPIPLAHIDK